MDSDKVLSSAFCETYTVLKNLQTKVADLQYIHVWH